MNSKPRVLTLVGTRPEIIRLSALVPKLDALTEHLFVHTGQNDAPELSDVFFKDLGLRRPDKYLGVDTSSMASVMAGTMLGVEEVLRDFRPDAVMILGDTNSAIGAIVAERMHVPVYHMEAGNRSFDSNVPEELNRRMIDHISTFNLPYNSYSYANLIREGIHPRFLQKTGSPIAEIWAQQNSKVAESNVLEQLELTPESFVLVSLHRQENVDDVSKFEGILNGIARVADSEDVTAIVSTHPRTRKALENLKFDNPRIKFLDAFGYIDYMKLQTSSRLVISDSGTISEESAIVGFPAICARDSIERQEAIDSGHTILAGTSPDSIAGAFRLAMLREFDPPNLPEGYESPNFSERVVSFLFSTYHVANLWRGRKPRIR